MTVKIGRAVPRTLIEGNLPSELPGWRYAWFIKWFSKFISLYICAAVAISEEIFKKKISKKLFQKNPKFAPNFLPKILYRKFCQQLPIKLPTSKLGSFLLSKPENSNFESEFLPETRKLTVISYLLDKKLILVRLALLNLPLSKTKVTQFVDLWFYPNLGNFTHLSVYR